MNTYKFQLQYFKSSGKYYSEGWLEIVSEEEPAMYRVFEIAREKLTIRRLPGLVDGCSEFDVVVTGEGHTMGFPLLIKASSV